MTTTFATLEEWHVTWDLILGLWPKWKYTENQRKLWEDTLRPCP